MRGPDLAAVAVLALVLSPPATVQAGPPTEQVKAHVDRVLKILDDPEMRKDARTAERRAAIRGIAAELFDFTEISRRSLARHWRPRTPAEREEFVPLFGALLERAYISKLELYSGEKIEYVAEVRDGDLAMVRTRIVTRHGTQIPVDYRMLQQGDRWRVYDVLIEGVSLVGNYRTQFNAVIRRSSYDGLVKALRAKLGEPPPDGQAVPAAQAPARTGGPSHRAESP